MQFIGLTKENTLIPFLCLLIVLKAESQLSLDNLTHNTVIFQKTVMCSCLLNRAYQYLSY